MPKRYCQQCKSSLPVERYFHCYTCKPTLPTLTNDDDVYIGCNNTLEDLNELIETWEDTSNETSSETIKWYGDDADEST